MQVYGHLTYIVHCETLSFYMRHYCHRLDTGFSTMPNAHPRWAGGDVRICAYLHMRVSIFCFDSQHNELNMTICIIAETRELRLQWADQLTDILYNYGRGNGQWTWSHGWVCAHFGCWTNSNAKCMTVLLFNFQPVKCYGLAQDLQDNSRSWSGQDSGDSWYGFTFSYCCICLEMQIVWNIFHTIMCVFDELIWVDIGLEKPVSKVFVDLSVKL